MRTLRLYLTAFLLLSIAGLSACSLYPGGSSGPPAELAVVQANDLGTFGTNPKILGRDGGYSGVFAGFAVWVYGDTFLANPNAQAIRAAVMQAMVGHIRGKAAYLGLFRRPQ